MLRNEFILQRCHRDFHDGDIEAESDTSRLSDGPLCTHLMTVLDVKGIKFSDFSADVIRLEFSSERLLIFFQDLFSFLLM